VLLHVYPKFLIISYEKTMPLFTSFLWFPRFQPSSLNLAIFHLVTSTMLCYLWTFHSNLANLMNISIFYSTSALFFFQISTLCLYPFWKSFSLSNSSYNIAFSFSPIANLLECLPPKSNSPYLDLQLPWFKITELPYLFSLLLQLLLP